MSVVSRINQKAKNNADTGSGVKKGAKSIKGAKFVSTDLGVDLEAMYKDLSTVRTKSIANKLNTIVRSAATRNLRKGGGGSQVGQSKKDHSGEKKGYGTRGDYKNQGGKNYLKDGWAGKVLSKRGADKKGMSEGMGQKNGGITSPPPKANRNGVTKSITGPRHSKVSRGDKSGKHGYNYAHMLEFGGKHKAWNNTTAPLKAKPFMGPAGESTRPQQEALIKAEYAKWAKQ